MNSETFIYGLEVVYNALYKLYRPKKDAEFDIIKKLIECYVMMLSDFDLQKYKTINNFLLTQKTFDKDKAYLLYTYLSDNEKETKKN